VVPLLEGVKLLFPLPSAAVLSLPVDLASAVAARTLFTTIWEVRAAEEEDVAEITGAAVSGFADGGAALPRSCSPIFGNSLAVGEQKSGKASLNRSWPKFHA